MITIRPATPEDCQQIFDFIMELAIYEKASEQVVTDVDRINQSLFGQGSNAQALICFVDGVVAGMSIYFFNYSTWLGKRGLFLEDLYVSPGFRGKGAGMALMKKLANIALEQDCGRFEWNVLDWNKPSIDFYDSIGAKPQSEWIGYRMQGNKLRTFAGS